LLNEIRIHGQGGQGVVVASELIALAASFEGKFCRSFPLYGSARRGGPVVAFTQIGEESEATRSMIYEPNNVLILDPHIPNYVDVVNGIKPGGTIIFNTSKNIEESRSYLRSFNTKIAVIDATSISEELLGLPMPNTVILGAFINSTKILKIDSMLKAVEKRFDQRIVNQNKKAVLAGYDNISISSPVEVLVH